MCQVSRWWLSWLPWWRSCRSFASSSSISGSWPRVSPVSPMLFSRQLFYWCSSSSGSSGHPISSIGSLFAGVSSSSSAGVTISGVLSCLSGVCVMWEVSPCTFIPCLCCIVIAITPSVVSCRPLRNSAFVAFSAFISADALPCWVSRSA